MTKLKPMFKPFFIFVGSRYTRANRKNYFISFTSLISIFSIGLGVTVLITVLSVMNGFSKEIRAQMLSVTPHITLKGFDVRLKSTVPESVNLEKSRPSFRYLSRWTQFHFTVGDG